MKKLLTALIPMMVIYGCSGSPNIIDNNGEDDDKTSETPTQPNENGGGKPNNGNNTPDNSGNDNKDDKDQNKGDKVNNGIDIGVNDWEKDDTDNGGNAQ